MSRMERHRKPQIIVSVTFLALIMLSLIGARTSPVVAALQSGRAVPILLFGTDTADKSQHTDTLMVSVLHPTQNELGFLSIPRDTRIRLPGYLFHRVNEIFGFHLRKKKTREVASANVVKGVEHILSSEDRAVRIPFYFNVDYSGFQKVVDLLGGVWVEVNQPMHYDDYAGDLHIHFEPGSHLLKGKDALRYVRFRGQTGDKGRIYRQQAFLRNMAKRLADPTVVLKVPSIVKAIYSSVHTNMSFWDFLYLANSLRRIRSNDLGFYILPGQPRGPFWQVKRDPADRLVSRLFFGDISNEGYLEPVVPLEGQVTVNVWNASGRRGTAYQITTYLRRAGFDVVEWGTYPAEQIQTRVIDRKGQIENARAVGRALAIQSCHSEPNPSALIDVEVVIGQDYRLPPSTP